MTGGEVKRQADTLLHDCYADAGLEPRRVVKMHPTRERLLSE